MTRSLLLLRSYRKENEELLSPLPISVSSDHVVFQGRSMSAYAGLKKYTKKKTWFDVIQEIDEENEKLVHLEPKAFANKRLRRAQTFYT